MFSPRAHRIGFGVALTALACASEGQPAPARETPPEEPAHERVSLVEATGWDVLSGADDPFMDRPDGASCPDDTYMPEWLSGEPVFSVNTGGCTYLTARQALQRRIVAGETLVLRVWHFALNADAAAVAHVAVRLGDETLLDRTVPIPAAGGLLQVEQVAPQRVPQGTDVYFHLHNHGDNSWSFVELSTGPARRQ